MVVLREETWEVVKFWRLWIILDHRLSRSLTRVNPLADTWKPRSGLCVGRGMSPYHTRNLAGPLILNFPDSRTMRDQLSSLRHFSVADGTDEDTTIDCRFMDEQAEVQRDWVPCAMYLKQWSHLGSPINSSAFIPVLAPQTANPLPFLLESHWLDVLMLCVSHCRL